MGIYDSVLLTADFDGTLTDGKATIPERNVEAIRYFMAEGGTFTVNTGRSVPMFSSQLPKVPVNAPLLLYNGGAAYDAGKKELLYSETIPLDLWDTVRKAHALVPEMLIEIQGLDAHYAFHENGLWARLNEKMGCPYCFVKPGADIGPFLKFTLLGPFHPEKAEGIFEGSSEDEPKISHVVELLKELVGDKASVFQAGSRIVDVQAPGASKANSARWLKEKLGKEILVCIGDGKNDIPMLQGADYAFCPADGTVADQFPNVCPCAAGSVADVIYEKIPEILRGKA